MHAPASRFQPPVGAEANGRPTTPSNAPRQPNPEELRDLAGYLREVGHFDDDADLTARLAYAAVFDDYCTDCPGHSGKVMSVVWSGSPSFFDVFYWHAGAMVRSGRDYDKKECVGCGARSGTYCWDCWRRP